MQKYLIFSYICIPKILSDDNMRHTYNRNINDYAHYQVEQDDTLLNFLLNNVKESRSKIKATLQGRGIKVNGKTVTQFDYPVAAGTKIEVSKTKRNNDKLKSRYVKIVYEDQYLVVIEKNIGILSMALTMLVWHCVWVSTHGREMAIEARQLGVSVQGGQRKPWALFVAVALAVLREGAETVLFVVGSLTGGGPVGTASVLLACALGLVAGAVVGVALYAGLSRIPTQKLFAATNVLIALLAASIASQLARALTQAGLLEHGTAQLWDSSALLASDSALGALLHALDGYDARPSAVQLGFYVTVLAGIYFGTRLVMRQLRTNAPLHRTHPT